MKKTPAHFIPIMGTWDLNNAYGWWRKDSQFSQYAANHNIIRYPREPFIWSSDIDGAFEVVPDRKHWDWRAGGASLSYYLENVQYSNRNLIAHSHALQVVGYAIRDFRLDIRRLITIGSPVRRDLYPLYESVQNNCQEWLHIYDKQYDLFSNLGMLFDGNFSLDRSMPFAKRNQAIDGICHSNIIEDPQYFPMWDTENWFDFLR